MSAAPRGGEVAVNAPPAAEGSEVAVNAPAAAEGSEVAVNAPPAAEGSEVAVNAPAAAGGAEGCAPPARPAGAGSDDPAGPDRAQAADRPRRRGPAAVLRSIPKRVFRFYWGDGIADDVPALAYYLVLSLAPFALGLAALEALLLEDVVSAIAVSEQLNRFLPEAIHGDIRGLVVGTRDNSPLLLAVALFAMLWTTSGAIGVIERCLSRILDVPRHNIFLGRIRNLGLGALVAVAVILASLSISVVTNLSYELRPRGGFPGPMILVFNALGSMFVFAVIYRYGPLTKMRWRSALIGGIPGGLAIQAVPAVVGLYVSAAAGFAPAQLFLLLAIILGGLYIVALLLLVGAGVAARIELHWLRGAENDELPGRTLATGVERRVDPVA